MDARKVRQWLTLQQRKGGPALAILEQWVEELRPPPSLNPYEGRMIGRDWPHRAFFIGPHMRIDGFVDRYEGFTLSHEDLPLVESKGDRYLYGTALEEFLFGDSSDEPPPKMTPKESHRALNKHERRWRKK